MLQYGLFKHDSIREESDQLAFISSYWFQICTYGGIDPKMTLLQKIEKAAYESSCDDLTIRDFKDNATETSPSFLKSIQLINDLNSSGIEVILIPPTVVGDECYTQYQDNFNFFLSNLFALLDKNDIRFLGTPEYFKMSSSHFLNTPYHILPNSRTEYTNRLYQLFVQNNVFKKQPPSPSLKSIIAQAIQNKEKLLRQKAIQNLKPWDGNTSTINKNWKEDRIWLDKGWFKLEDTFVWSEGYKSTLFFYPSKSALSKRHLIINAQYFLTPEQTEIQINGTKLASLNLSENNSILLPKPLSEYVDQKGLVELTLTHTNPQRPADHIDGSQDSRLIKLAFMSISITE